MGLDTFLILNCHLFFLTEVRRTNDFDYERLIVNSWEKEFNGKIERPVLFKDQRFVTTRYTKKVRKSVVYESRYILIERTKISEIGNYKKSSTTWKEKWTEINTSAGKGQKSRKTVHPFSDVWVSET